ncbi:hypothetical protein Tco_1062809 [Tanacetum coccineum]
MTTLAEHIIVARAQNCPPMLEKSMYGSWESRIRLFIKGKKHGRMMLDSIDNGPLVYLIVEENGKTRPKKYSKLTEAQQLQDDCDVQATIILHDFLPDVYALVNHQEVKHCISTTGDSLSSSMTCILLQGEDLIECINKVMAFLSAVALRPRNSTWFKEKLMLAEAQEASQILDEEQLAFLADPNNLDAYDSDCADLSSAKAVLMANLSSYDPEVLSEVAYSESYPNDMINQDVKEMHYSEQTHVDDFEDNKIHSGSNIISYSQYLQETQDAVI